MTCIGYKACMAGQHNECETGQCTYVTVGQQLCQSDSCVYLAMASVEVAAWRV